MKDNKEYFPPQVEVFELQVEQQCLSGSYTTNGFSESDETAW